MSGDNSLTSWKTVHTLSDYEVRQYKSDDGIRLRIMRQGKLMAVWLGNTLLVIEDFGDKMQYCSAQIGLEVWIANQGVMEIPFTVSAGVPVDVAGSPFHWPANIWDISNQYNGTFTKFPAPGKDTWLDTKIDCNDVTTVCKDLDPESKTYCMIYIFKFSNGENFRLRLNHTDNDGKFRVQSFAGSTLSPVWKNYYTLTDEQAQKALTDGVAYRVQILGTTAYVYIDGQPACTVDLSTNINTGKPSGIEDATVRVSFRLDGNNVGNTVIPFKLENNAKNVTLNIEQPENGTITAEKTNYKIGDTVKLIVTGAENYYYSNISVDGMPVKLNWDGTYSFVAEKNIYNISGVFEQGILAENSESAWNLVNQNQGVLLMESHESGNSGMISATGVTNKVYTVVKDLTPDAKDFSMIYNFAFSNGEKFVVRLNHTDDDGKYRIQSMSGSTVVAPWKNAYTLTDAEAAKVEGDGIKFQVTIKGTTAYVQLDDADVCTYDLSKVVATGNPSGIESATVSASIRMDGNLGQDVELPFGMADTSQQVIINIDDMVNGTVTTDKVSYKVGDTVNLIITPDAGYSHKLYINGQPLLLDYETGNYSFEPEAEVPYNITGGFVLKESWFWTENWDLLNQGHGIAHAPAHTDGTQRTGDLVPAKGKYNGVSVLVQDVSHGAQKEYAVVLKMHFAGGKKAEVRLIDRDDNGKYCLQAMGDSFSGWNTLYWLTSAENEAVMNGNGVWYSMVRDGTTIRLLINGNNVKEINLTGQGITADTVLDQIKLQAYNFGYAADIPYIFKVVNDGADEGDTNVEINIAELTNGTVTADKASYKLGETATLTVTPNAGYSQKLFINGKALKLDWKTNQYSFTVEEEAYNITGSFEESVEEAPSDAARWDSSNQAHGVITTYYPANDNSWWYNINGDYKSIAVTAKNYLPLADSSEGNGTIGYSVVLAATLDNGKLYAFRIINEKESGTNNARFIYTRYGASGSVTGWGGWCQLETKVPGVTEKLQGDGAEFKLSRTGDNTLQITLDGVVLDTYTMEGVTAANKITSVGIYHYGNRGQKVEIPFDLVKPGEVDDVQLTIASMTNGTVTADKASYKGGETVTLTVTPASGYVQKLYINGDPLLLDHATGKYSFVASEAEYNITGDFVKKSDWFWTGDWNLSNQGHSVAHAPAHPAGTERTGDLVPTKGICNGVSVLFTDASAGKQTAFAIVLKMHFAGGKKAEVRLVDRDDNGKYCLQAMGDSFSSWNTLYWLTDEENAAVLNGKGVWYGMKREGTKVILTINNVVVKEIDVSSQGITASTVLDQVKVQAYNFGYELDVPYVFQMTQ